MTRQDQIINERMRKLNELKAQGINPYPHKYEPKDKSSALQEKYKKLKKGGKTNYKAKVAGRLMSFRDFGKISFGVVQDSAGKIQITFQSGETPEKASSFFKKYIDIGDFVGVEGKIHRTEKGELSILASKIELLAKSILPLPEKWHGLQDEEERYRKRYLDLTINQEVKEIFEKRAIILQAMREFMAQNNFIEVETPILQTVYGGALAKPFKTHIEAYNIDVYLSIAPELPLKKALVGGFERVYEITKKFRNEGVDRSHNPEHMTIEWYQAYASYEEGMDLFEDFMKHIAKRLFGKLAFEYQGHKINLANWKRISLDKAIKEYLGEDVSKIKSDEEAIKLAENHGIKTEGITKANIQDELMKLFRHKLIQPTFLIDYPIESSPLAKPKRGDPTKAEVFQPFIGGLELARAYSELSDPLLQEKNFLEQEKDREKGNKEAMPIDADFVTALKQGMPPACGVGIGIERVVMLLTNQTSIRDVILFPFMRPLEEEKSQINENKIITNSYDKAKVIISEEARNLGLKTAYAIIEGVNVKKSNSKLEELKKSLKFQTNKDRVNAMHNAYKKFGVDPKNRPPSSTALIKRLENGKGLYDTNTLVDAYNITSIQESLPMAAYDLEKINFPITLRKAKTGETITLIGGETKKINEGEIIYVDTSRVLCLDFNYRDCDHTKITEGTKKIIGFVDGSEGIEDKEVLSALDKACHLIVFYNGGKITDKGIVK